MTRALGLESAQPRPIVGDCSTRFRDAPDHATADRVPGICTELSDRRADRRIRRQTDARRRRPLLRGFSGTECRRSVPPTALSSSSPIPRGSRKWRRSAPTRWPGLLLRTVLDVSTFPAVPPRLADPAADPVGCLTWTPQGAAQATTPAASKRLSRWRRDARCRSPTMPARSGWRRPTGPAITRISPTSVRCRRVRADDGPRVRQRAKGRTVSSSPTRASGTGSRTPMQRRHWGFEVPGAPAPWRIVELLAPGPTLGKSAALGPRTTACRRHRSGAGGCGQLVVS